MVVVGDVSMLLRALKGPELACLFAIMMSPEPAKVCWLETVTGLSAHTVTGALNTLQALGLAQHNGRRSDWLPAGGFCKAFLKRAVEVPGAGEHPALSPPVASIDEMGGMENPDGANRQSGERGIVKHGGTLHRRANRNRGNRSAANRGDEDRGEPDRVEVSTDVSALEAAEHTGENRDTANRGAEKRVYTGTDGAHRDLAMRGAAMRGLIVKEEEVEGVNSNPLTSPSDLKAGPSQNLRSERTEPTGRSPGEIDALDAAEDHKRCLRRILAATQVLFGETVLGPPERYPDPDLLLGSIAEAYCRRSHLRNPARVVYTNLKNGTPPAQEYLADPLAHLPVAYLRAAGLIPDNQGEPDMDDSTTGAGGWEETSSDLFEVEAPAETRLLDPSINLPVAIVEDPKNNRPNGNGRTAYQAWQVVRASLLTDLPLSTYRRFIDPLQLVHFEVEECAFTLLAQDDYSQQWLEQRVRLTLVHLLTGICNRPAQVVILA